MLYKARKATCTVKSLYSKMRKVSKQGNEMRKQVNAICHRGHPVV